VGQAALRRADPPRTPRSIGEPDALTAAKDLYRLIEKYNDGPMMKAITELRDDVFRLSEENRDLKAKVRELEEQLSIKAKLFREKNNYYYTDESGKKMGPYCMTCWDGDRKLVNVPTYEFAGHRFPDGCRLCYRVSQSGK
jgi:hypothetical protein